MRVVCIIVHFVTMIW